MNLLFSVRKKNLLYGSLGNGLLSWQLHVMAKVFNTNKNFFFFFFLFFFFFSFSVGDLAKKKLFFSDFKYL